MDPADFVTTLALREHLARGATGKLVVGSGIGAFSVYIMGGVLMGAEAADEPYRMLRRLGAERLISVSRSEELRALIADGESIFGELFDEIPGDRLDEILFDRFEDALTSWIAIGEEPSFTSLAAVFIDNLQMSVDAEAAINAACERLTAASAMPRGAQLMPGPSMPRGKPELAIRALLRADMTVPELVDQLPMEPWTARATIASMIETRGLLAEQVDDPEEQELTAPLVEHDASPAPADSPAPHEEGAAHVGEAESPEQAVEHEDFAPDDAGDEAVEPVEQPQDDHEVADHDGLEEAEEEDEAAEGGPQYIDDWIMDDDQPADEAPHDSAAADEEETLKGSLEITDLEGGDDSENLEPSPTEAETEQHNPKEDAPDEFDAFMEHLEDAGDVGDEGIGTVDDESEDVTERPDPTPRAIEAPSEGFVYGDLDDDLMDAFEEADAPTIPVKTHSPPSLPEVAKQDPLASVAEALGSSLMDDEEVVEAFNDASDYRGGGKNAGAFMTQSHNLDIVSLDGMEEEIEFDDDPPSQSFGAPPLSEEDAQNKIDVVNQILEVFSDEYNKAQGAGAGRSAVQLLIDGSPKPYKPLYDRVIATERGGLPKAQVLRNLYSRPSSEHRRLLREGLINIVDRSMSIAADELPDEGIDNVLESTAGFRQRIGL